MGNYFISVLFEPLLSGVLSFDNWEFDWPDQPNDEIVEIEELFDYGVVFEFKHDFNELSDFNEVLVILNSIQKHEIVVFGHSVLQIYVLFRIFVSKQKPRLVLEVNFLPSVRLFGFRIFFLFFFWFLSNEES